MNKINFILKSEAFAFFVLAVWLYYTTNAGWILFFILLLTPDFFMIGYLKNSKLGAMIYNIGHTYTAPLILLAIFLVFQISILLPISLIWIAHISMDRMLGYGLKLDTNFKDTNLGRIGK
ncbi:MAG: DUF4260 domain-containing protein [bacterium]|nr:DUF4260 domain-containing protein [bacterium]